MLAAVGLYLLSLAQQRSFAAKSNCGIALQQYFVDKSIDVAQHRNGEAQPWGKSRDNDEMARPPIGQHSRGIASGMQPRCKTAGITGLNQSIAATRYQQRRRHT
jgi:hypothetical protein